MNNKKIIVGLSGGVDSSVAAALLAREGHEVIGAFMKNWSDSKDPATGLCSWKQDYGDAKAAADHLGIPLLVFDFEEEYREAVVEYLFSEYEAGRTPNPDVLCNKHIKFDLFLERALAEGADAIATGHYARVEQTADRFALFAGVDKNKDQSYFLHQLTQYRLARTLFPVGHFEKREVRRMAAEFGLPTAGKKDSQGICFVGKVDLAEFLSKRIPERIGPIVTTDGHVIGRHKGIAPYTIGQRHGLGVGGGAPYYVVEKDAARNTLVVAHSDEHEAICANSLIAADPHWISGASPDFPLRCQARIRYRQPLQQAIVRSATEGLSVDFDTPQRAITPGQFVVFYDGEACLGGAVIDNLPLQGIFQGGVDNAADLCYTAPIGKKLNTRPGVLASKNACDRRPE